MFAPQERFDVAISPRFSPKRRTRPIGIGQFPVSALRANLHQEQPFHIRHSLVDFDAGDLFAFVLVERFGLLDLGKVFFAIEWVVGIRK